MIAMQKLQYSSRTWVAVTLLRHLALGGLAVCTLITWTELLHAVQVGTSFTKSHKYFK